MSSKSRSRSRSRSPNYRSYKSGNHREDSISPIRTASGANLRVPRGRGYMRNNYGYNNYNTYPQRNYYHNNRGYYNNQRNNYGNRWNRGRGNFRGQGWYGNNNWNNRGHRNRHNSRSERSRSRSYDRERSRSRSSSRSRSGGRSRSRSYDRHRRKSRSRSYKSSDRSYSKSKSRSKSPKKVKSKKASKAGSKTELPKRSPERPARPVIVPSVQESEKEEEEEQVKPRDESESSFSKSRWETPDRSPDRNKKIKMEPQSDLQRDEIFDQWDDDKLRAYLLKANTKKLEKEGRKTADDAAQVSSAPVVKKKKKRTKSNAESPSKESSGTRGRKKKKAAKLSRSSSSSSSSWSPIHKALDGKKGNLDTNKPLMVNPVTSAAEQEFGLSTTVAYSQRQVYPSSAERMQAVQYPFGHIRKTAPPAASVASAMAVSDPEPVKMYPAPVPPPPPSQPPTMAGMHILGPDGKPIKLVTVSVRGPDGNMIEMMQIPPTVSVTQPEPIPSPVAQASPMYRAPPPPPSYPPPPPHSNASKYPLASRAPDTTAAPQAPDFGMVAQEPRRDEYSRKQAENTVKNEPPVPVEVPPLMKAMQIVEDQPYSTADHSTGLKRLEAMEKQKRRQEVLRTRFKPRPASTWAREVKEAASEGKKKQQQSEVFEDTSRENGSTQNVTKESHGSEKYQIPGLSPEKEISKIQTIDSSGAQPIQSVMSSGSREHGNQTSISPHSQPQQITSGPVKKPIEERPCMQIPPQLAAQGFKPVDGNAQILVGPGGEMLQLISGPPLVSGALSLVQTDMTGMLQQAASQPRTIDDRWTNAAEAFIRGKPEEKGNDSSSDSEEKVPEKPIKRNRTVSAGSDKKGKKKTRTQPSGNITDMREEPGGDAAGVKRKKEAKKKKKKNKKKKEENEEDANSPKEKKKKKEKRQKERSEISSIESELQKSKKELKGPQDVKKVSKNDNLIRSIADDLPLSHIRSIVPRRKEEGSQSLIGHINFESGAKSSLATSTSYEERFVSLFGSGETEATHVDEERVDITKKAVRKFKVDVTGTRSVSHMTQVCVSDRIRMLTDSKEKTPPQKVSLNVSSLSKLTVTRKKKSPSRSRSQSSSVSSVSQEHARRRKSESKSKSRSRSRSRSRSISLPLAYSTDSKAKRSRSWSSDEDRDRYRGQQRQPYYNRNNQQYNYNQRGRGQFNRGYYNNYRGRGRGYNNNYQNRGNWNNNRGRYQNWNQGYNRDQNYRYQRYDNRNDRSSRDRYDDDRSPDRSRRRDDRTRSRSRDKESNKDSKRDDRSPREDKKTREFPAHVEDKSEEAKDAGVKMQVAAAAQPKREPSPAQWQHDMFENHEMEGDGNK